MFRPFLTVAFALLLLAPVATRSQQPAAAAGVQSAPDTGTAPPGQLVAVAAPQAQALLARSLAAMGGAVPADSVATGEVTLTEGSTVETGPIKISTRGISQTSEELNLPDDPRSVVFSNFQATSNAKSGQKRLPMELAAANRSSAFPLPIIASAVQDPEIQASYLGRETLDGNQVEHLQIWKTFSSSPRLRQLATFSKIDLYLDPQTDLPARISVVRQRGGLNQPSAQISTSYGSYKAFSGVLYPTSITRTLNGSTWLVISINSVSFSTGLSDANFPMASWRKK